METTFEFLKPSMEYIYSLHPKSEIILHIKRITIDTASLFFTNQLNQKIDIPSDFILLKNGKILKLETSALHHFSFETPTLEGILSDNVDTFSALEMRKCVES